MSQENVEVVKRIFRGWDESGVEGMLPFFHEDIEYRPMEEGGAVHGHDALRRYFERWMEPWEQFQVAPTDLRSCGDSVFNGVDMKGRGRGSGVETTMEYWQVWRFSDVRAARWEEYLDRAEALEAVGLRE
ncbi:MAG: nuclear transport factor 2 family protein [Actinomycetota bacterium]|nr:nuclear transport factor 2 family protein [Actinomycetota bacterium]